MVYRTVGHPKMDTEPFRSALVGKDLRIAEESPPLSLGRKTLDLYREVPRRI